MERRTSHGSGARAGRLVPMRLAALLAMALVAAACGGKVRVDHHEPTAGGAGGGVGSGGADSCSVGGMAAVPCNEDPWSCPMGTTCWVDEDAEDFACLEAGPTP